MNPNLPPDHVTVFIDGVEMAAPKGSMIIQAADKAGIPIPRFCYHDKLPIAANCRMCLVEVEKMPEAAPACATPVMDGMKVFTRSEKALKAQRNVMEFLLINHPLDCPICDQGGECELQDLSMGYGRSVSRFDERKRVVPDEDIGPLVATDMTRCIQCTRCVRFTAEIAGTYELGGMYRGENLQIGTYDGKPLTTELSGNVIDVCPVGALTNKVFQFKARPWELIARESLGYHDALGSNLFLHVRRGEVLRTVPRDNEAVNECWLSDRDRYSHQGLYAADRAVRADGRRTATTGAKCRGTKALARGCARSCATTPPTTSACSCTRPRPNEEGACSRAWPKRWAPATSTTASASRDLSDGAVAEPFAMPVAEIEQADAIVIVGSNLRHELPLLHAARPQGRTHARRQGARGQPGRLRFRLRRSPASRSSRRRSLPVRLDDAALRRRGEGRERAPVVIVGALAENGIRRPLRIRAAAQRASPRRPVPRCAASRRARTRSALRAMACCRPVARRRRRCWPSRARPMCIYGIEPGLDFADALLR